MPVAYSNSSSGRAASLARRQALSAGKTALPPAAERVRNGDRSAAIPNTAATHVAPPAAAVSAVPSAPVSAVAVPPRSALAGGRAASLARRRALSAGKAALPPATERIRNGDRSAAVPVAAAAATAHSAAVAPAAAAFPAASVSAVTAPPRPALADCAHANCEGSCNGQARARRAMMSQRGRGEQPAAPPSRPPRNGTLNFAPKVVVSTTHAGQIVTGSRIGRGRQVTGDEPGSYLPVSGTQYIAASDGPAVRSGGPKVGLARTTGGAIVSGSLVRSQVRVTGDEPGGRITITGEADQNAQDDVTPRAAEGAPVASQFNRQVDPHGHSVFGTNLGRSAVSLGSRVRTREAPLESTENGLAITGSAVGRGGRVTGDENGACRSVTGNQYLTPARAQAECGGTGGGTAPAVQLGARRRDPVTGGKVGVAQTWGQQRQTGSNVEHDPRVTGEAAGSCAIITGTAYQGAATIHGWCDPGVAAAAEDRLVRRAASASISGDLPGHSDSVTGLHRGAARELTGTPYFGTSPAAAAEGATQAPDAVAALDARFSVASPQRRAQLRARAAQANGASQAGSSPAITGSFANGLDRVTGNVEFSFRSRSAVEPDAPAAHSRLTGEGRVNGVRVTGWSWSDQSNVTGTEGATAVERNPSERGDKAKAFSGAKRFKELAKREDTRQLVTGLLGWSGKTAARVTLSGGAQA